MQNDWDPVTKKIVKGRFLGKKQHELHKRQEQKAGIAPADALPTHGPSTLQLPLPISPILSPVTPHNLKTTSLTFQGDKDCPPETPKDQAGTENHSATRLVLEHLSEMLKIREREHKSFGRLSFLNPPHSESIPIFLQPLAQDRQTIVNSGPFALDHHAPNNTKLLGYEEWLFESYLVAEGLVKCKDVRVRLRAKATKSEMENEIERVESIKMGEWEEQRRIAVESPQGQIRSRKSTVAFNTGQFCYVCLSAMLIFVVLTHSNDSCLHR